MTSSVIMPPPTTKADSFKPAFVSLSAITESRREGSMSRQELYHSMHSTLSKSIGRQVCANLTSSSRES